MCPALAIRFAVVLTFVTSALMFPIRHTLVLTLWVMPASNQAFRVLVYNA